jgi:serine/threonine protein kinase
MSKRDSSRIVGQQVAPISKKHAGEHTLELDHLKCVRDVYIFKETIGKGTYGSVSFAVKKGDPTEKRVAIKTFFPGTHLDVQVDREIECLKRLAGHVNIIRVLDLCTDKDRGVHVVLEGAKHDLRGLLEHAPFAMGMDGAQAKGFFAQLMNGLAYCHSKNIVHRDLKPENLLVMADGHLKIGDWGMGKVILPGTVRQEGERPFEHSNPITTQWYRAPEIYLKSRTYDAAVDIWSAGCILGELLFGTVLIKGQCTSDEEQSDAAQMSCIWKLCGTPVLDEWPPEFHKTIRTFCRSRINRDLRNVLGKHNVNKHRKALFTPEAINVLDGMLQLLPSKRPTAAALLESPYLKGEAPLPLPPGAMVDWLQGHFSGMKKR